MMYFLLAVNLSLWENGWSQHGDQKCGSTMVVDQCCNHNQFYYFLYQIQDKCNKIMLSHGIYSKMHNFILSLFSVILMSFFPPSCATTKRWNSCCLWDFTIAQVHLVMIFQINFWCSGLMLKSKNIPAMFLTFVSLFCFWWSFWWNCIWILHFAVPTCVYLFGFHANRQN